MGTLLFPKALHIFMNTWILIEKYLRFYLKIRFSIWCTSMLDTFWYNEIHWFKCLNRDTWKRTCTTRDNCFWYESTFDLSVFFSAPLLAISLRRWEGANKSDWGSGLTIPTWLIHLSKSLLLLKAKANNSLFSNLFHIRKYKYPSTQIQNHKYTYLPSQDGCSIYQSPSSSPQG